tara:strand:- start:213 stop:422 length:210 start_codon:yes stop_codon:yes gene_type:complete
MKNTKTKKELKKELDDLIEQKNNNMKRIQDEMKRSSGMSHGEMKSLLHGVKVFKTKINALEKKINDGKN